MTQNALPANIAINPSNARRPLRVSDGGLLLVRDELTQYIVDGDVFLHSGSTTVNNNAVFDHLLITGTNATGGTGNSGNTSFILKPSTKYLFRTTNIAAGNKIVAFNVQIIERSMS